MNFKITVIFILLCCPIIIHGQLLSFNDSNCNFTDRSHLFTGWVVNIPKQFLGFTFAFTTPKSLGFYLDMKSGYPIREFDKNFYRSLTVDEVENTYKHLHFATDENWITLNFGFTKTISKNFSIYSGLGFSQYTEYRKYYDQNEILGTNGDYWIKDENECELKSNFFIGLIAVLRASQIGQIGFETKPPGVTVGFGFAIL